MDARLREAIVGTFGPMVAEIGFAPVERFDEAPERHHPAQVCKGAQTVIVFAAAVPSGVFSSPRYSLHAMHRSYHSIYRRLDELVVQACSFVEARGAYRAVPVPSFAPMVYNSFSLEPWGILSLKHAAVRAGLGAFGRSGQVYHPEYGARLRFGAVVTSAELEGDAVMDIDPCPQGCAACRKVCPSHAFDEEGSFGKMACLAYTIKHAIYPLALKDAEGLKNIERVVNTAGYDYWIACNECIKACPNNRDGGSTGKGGAS